MRTRILWFFTVLFLLLQVGCTRQPQENALKPLEPGNADIKGALLGTSLNSMAELQEVVRIEYFSQALSPIHDTLRSYEVRLTYLGNGVPMSSSLKSGVSQVDLIHAQQGGFWERLWLLTNSPFAVMRKSDIKRAFFLARRKGENFGEGDMAFFDFALSMMGNVRADDRALMSEQERSEKGHINTFNHLVGQAFLTTLFSERFAEFVAGAHELKNIPELPTGKFTAAQLADLENGPLDNYVDMINNEFGQELGKKLKEKYGIDRNTNWTPELLANYLNDIQRYYSWAFQIGFEPFRETDVEVVRFASKINRVMGAVDELELDAKRS